MKARCKQDKWIPLPGHIVPVGSHPGDHWIVSTIAVVTVVALLLIGLLSDNYFNPILLGSLFGGAIVGLWLYDRERSFVAPSRVPTRSPKELWKPEPQYLVPFGPYGGGQWTAHPIGLVIVIGLLLMGLVSGTPVSLLVLVSLVGGAIFGLFLWLRHR